MDHNPMKKSLRWGKGGCDGGCIVRGRDFARRSQLLGVRLNPWREPLQSPTKSNSWLDPGPWSLPLPKRRPPARAAARRLCALAAAEPKRFAPLAALWACQVCEARRQAPPTPPRVDMGSCGFPPSTARLWSGPQCAFRASDATPCCSFTGLHRFAVHAISNGRGHLSF